MSENKTIKNFSAADIEKYWNKKLSAAEMHEMEKAAMDDPFLADALEGYQYSKNAGEEIGILRERFNEKANDVAPVVPLNRKKYSWLKIAAAIIVLAGGGLIIQQLVLKDNKNSKIADVRERTVNTNDQTINADTSSKFYDSLTSAGVALGSNPPAVKKDSVTNYDFSSSLSSLKVSDSSQYNLTVAGADTSKENLNAWRSTTAQAKQLETKAAIDNKNADDKEKEAGLLANGDITQRKPEKKDLNDDKNISADRTKHAISANQDIPKRKAKNKELANDTLTAYAFGNVSKVSNRVDGETVSKPEAVFQDIYKQSATLNNSFNYRVVDNQNNPVPFANVMNTRDNVGTYTDVRGYFNLVSTDSVLDVKVSSLGFNSENYKLVPSKQPNNLMLKEDAIARKAMEYYQNRRVNSNVTRRDSAEVEEPEVGWGNYNTYVENNIKIPQNVRAKNALNEVELSFDVDKSGQPINIKVTKSSQCKECDDEAKRLLKEGPKWKRKGKKYKTTISIAVDQ